MKIPYIKIYVADLLAKSRHLTPEQIGQAVLGICEQAFDNTTSYDPKTASEKALFELLTSWKNESVCALKQKKNAGKKGGKTTQEKRKLSDGSTACLGALSRQNKQTETDTETEPETDTDKKQLLTAADAAEQVEKSSKPRKLNNLQIFSNRVIEEFEDLKTDDQKGVWFKRNCRCLSDILKFCGGDIDVALECIAVCVERLEKAGFKGGYEAVCRNLSLYYEQAVDRVNKWRKAKDEK